MLMLYLHEQHGGAELIRRIVETDALGEHAIDAAPWQTVGKVFDSQRSF